MHNKKTISKNKEYNHYKKKTGCYPKIVYKCSLQMDKRPENKDKTKILIEFL